MLPDWDFGGDDAKRRAFISWVWDELDRFAGMTALHSPPTDVPDEWLLEVQNQPKRKRHVGRPPEDHALKAWRGMSIMVWEYALLRYMFDRYWPGRRRDEDDPANAANIAVARNRDALARDKREHPTNARAYKKDYLSGSFEQSERLRAEWNRGTKSPGRKMAEADIAFLSTLPSERFAG